MPDALARDLIADLRRSHDRAAGLVRDLDRTGLSAQSYDTEWSIAQVLSHLGSGARIFTLILEAGVAGVEPPGQETFQTIWAEWNAMGPAEMRDSFLVADEALVRSLESMSDAQVDAFSLELWGMVLDVAAFARMRLAEHAVHTWDVEVALDPVAQVAAEAVALLLDGLPATAARSGKPTEEPFTVRLVLDDAPRTLLVRAGDLVDITTDDAASPVDGTLTLPSEAYLRLVVGRLDPLHTPRVGQAGERGLDDLRALLVGF